MKFIFNVLLFFSIFSSPLLAQEIYDLKVSGEFREQELRQVLDQLQQAHPVDFYYRTAGSVIWAKTSTTFRSTGRSNWLGTCTMLKSFETMTATGKEGIRSGRER